jgi:hypothetical protein
MKGPTAVMNGQPFGTLVWKCPGWADFVVKNEKSSSRPPGSDLVGSVVSVPTDALVDQG